jgi:DNA modification methylase
MTPFLQDADFTLYVGDALEVLRGLPDESVHCCVTSPPYWGLRDYGTGSWEGGDPECDHSRHVDYGKKNDTNQGAIRGGPMGQTCDKCGATRVDRQIGLESTPDEFVAAMVSVFREVRRVLRADGTCWLNLGDSYSHGGNGARDPERWPKQSRNDHRVEHRNRAGGSPKNLVGIPWRVAFALQADGWYLRSDIIWSKPNPMPESVTDRPTKAHEYLFLLSKSPRYFFDQEAVRESVSSVQPPRRFGRKEYAQAQAEDGYKGAREVALETGQGTDQSMGNHFGRVFGGHTSRNVRSVWEIATQPYPDAHFATFPEALPDRCIRAGTSERGCCPVCGAPWEREVERGESDYARLKREQGHDWTDMDAAGFERGVILKGGEGGQTRNANGTVPSLRAAARRDVGWRATCECGTVQLPRVRDGDVEPVNRVGALPILQPCLEPVPAVVLDPFMGSGTTALVARKLGRRSIGIELNEEYARLAARRLQQQSLFAGDAA